MKASLARSVEEMDDGEVWGRATMKRFSQEIVASNSPQSRRPAAVLLRQPPAAAAAGLHARAPAGLHARPPPAVSDRAASKAAPTRPPEAGKEKLARRDRPPAQQAVGADRRPDAAAVGLGIAHARSQLIYDLGQPHTAPNNPTSVWYVP